MNHCEAQRPIWSGGLRIEDAWTFCRIWVKLLLDEAAWEIWPEEKSHAELQRLICPGGLRIDDAWTFLSDSVRHVFFALKPVHGWSTRRHGLTFASTFRAYKVQILDQSGFSIWLGGKSSTLGAGQEAFWYEMSHAERQRRRWSGGLRIEDAGTFCTSDLSEASAGWRGWPRRVLVCDEPVWWASHWRCLSILSLLRWASRWRCLNIFFGLVKLLMNEALRVIWTDGKTPFLLAFLFGTDDGDTTCDILRFRVSRCSWEGARDQLELCAACVGEK